MAIKKLRLSFDVPIMELLALVATRNEGLHIDVIGDGKPDKLPKQLRGPEAQRLLEGPKPAKANGAGMHKVKAKDEHGPITTYQAIAAFLIRAPDHTGTHAIIKEALTPLGVNSVSISPQLAKMRKDGNVRQTAQGSYKLTAHGISRFEKMIKERETAAQTTGAQA